MHCKPGRARQGYTGFPGTDTEEYNLATRAGGGCSADEVWMAMDGLRYRRTLLLMAGVPGLRHDAGRSMPIDLELCPFCRFTLDVDSQHFTLQLILRKKAGHDDIASNSDKDIRVRAYTSTSHNEAPSSSQRGYRGQIGGASSTRS
ncbi:hypothetical protein OBBRIDRAFT_827601 [Obba rivulosa]|uniref:Uncharacterized protein n=1 Tax=Obba rivulosa TaxID=1052685 RepID=A0A8E2AVX1_9APHY|nr:hypothetical protein OBBRIDRAFT_827601 [Obba rivulosa]